MHLIWLLSLHPNEMENNYLTETSMKVYILDKLHV